MDGFHVHVLDYLPTCLALTSIYYLAIVHYYPACKLYASHTLMYFGCVFSIRTYTCHICLGGRREKLLIAGRRRSAESSSPQLR